MKQIQFNRSLVSLITGALLLAAPAALRADAIINVQTPAASIGCFWFTNQRAPIWQSFTVTTPGVFTTLSLPVDVSTFAGSTMWEDLYAGQGISGALQGSAQVSLIATNLSGGVNRLMVADFGGYRWRQVNIRCPFVTCIIAGWATRRFTHGSQRQLTGSPISALAVNSFTTVASDPTAW